MGKQSKAWERSREKRKSGAERNMTPFPRKLLPRNLVTVIIPLFAEVSHGYFQLVLHIGHGSCSASLTDILVVKPNHTSVGLASAVQRWAIIV